MSQTVYLMLITKRFSFDPENRLTSYGTQMTAGYRGDGLRAWKETNGTRTYFIYDGTLPVFETDLTDAGDRTNTFGAHGLVSRSGGVGAQDAVGERIPERRTVS